MRVLPAVLDRLTSGHKHSEVIAHNQDDGYAAAQLQHCEGKVHQLHVADLLGVLRAHNGHQGRPSGSAGRQQLLRLYQGAPLAVAESYCSGVHSGWARCFKLTEAHTDYALCILCPGWAQAVPVCRALRAQQPLLMSLQCSFVCHTSKHTVCKWSVIGAPWFVHPT